MTLSTPRFGLVLLVATLVLWAFNSSDAQPTTDTQEPKKGESMLVQYLEIVTPDVDETCSALEKMHGVTFSAPVAEFGNARTAALKGGGMIGVRAPMREDEHPVVRPYVLLMTSRPHSRPLGRRAPSLRTRPWRFPATGRPPSSFWVAFSTASGSCDRFGLNIN